MARLPGLPPGNSKGYGNFAQIGTWASGVGIRRKRQHIRRAINTSESPVEHADFAIADERDGHGAPGAGGRDAPQPARETLRGQAAPASVTDQDAQRRFRS